MNDFDSLQDWVKGLNKTQATTKEQLLDNYMRNPWFRRATCKKEESNNIGYIVRLHHDCHEGGELISESDGQFTGGYSTEVYRYAGDVYEFGFHEGKIQDMTRFDGRLY